MWWRWPGPHLTSSSRSKQRLKRSPCSTTLLTGGRARRELLFDAAATQSAIEELSGADLSALIVLQVTFTDATMIKALAEAVAAPVFFWAFPEERTGGRLRLNSLCGLNLAAYAMRRADIEFGYTYRRASDAGAAADLIAMLEGMPQDVADVPCGRKPSASSCLCRR